MQPLTPHSFVVRYGDRDYTMRLRIAVDAPFPPGYVYAAVMSLASAFVHLGDIWFHEPTANAFFSLITEGASEGVLRMPGQKDVPIPWKSWLELDADALREVSADFFDYVTTKILGLRESTVCTDGMREAIALMSTSLTFRNTSTRPILQLSKKKFGRSTTSAATASVSTRS